METLSPGLRDRKRRETRDRLERAALELTLRDGLDGATVVAISELADVSPRTFFNYFDTKEDAVLGLRDLHSGTEALAASAESQTDTTIVERVVHLLLSVMGSSLGDASLRTSRIEIMRQNPQLVGRQMAQMQRMHAQLVDATQHILAEDPRSESPPRELSDSAAEVLLALCGGAVRTAVREHIANNSSPTEEHLELRAIELTREVIETIQ